MFTALLQVSHMHMEKMRLEKTLTSATMMEALSLEDLGVNYIIFISSLSLFECFMWMCLYSPYLSFSCVEAQ